MVAFGVLTVGMLLFFAGFCLLLVRGVTKDSLEYDMEFLWENYPAETRIKIRETFR